MTEQKVSLDLSDHLVRSMVDRNHTPVEVWTTVGKLISVYCDMCGHSWPCDTRRALNALKERASDEA